MKEEVLLKWCTKTGGVPFDENREIMCPAYELIHEYLDRKGWTRLVFEPDKTDTSDRCFIKYEKVMKGEVDGKTIDILYELAVLIEGTGKSHGAKCGVNLDIKSFNPEDRDTPIGHESEAKILRYVRGVLAPLYLG